MAGEFEISIDSQAVLERFRTVLPGLTIQKIEQAFRVLMGRLEELVIQNIDSTFTGGHSAERPPHVKLRDAILATVKISGSEIVGEIGYDLAEVPYAAILEMGGSIPPHTILPRTAGALYFPTSTLKAFSFGEETTMDEFIVAFQVQHPGAYIAPYHYLLSVVAAMSKTVHDDIEVAVVKAIVESEGSSGGSGSTPGSPPI